ncbi:30S ribosomal protein S16 [Patescibacteria group bacterium]|nr:30S ribosomal protein S16 [Patescibacteria group bacterium]
MLTIRLVRKGKKNQAHFRVVVIDHKKAAQGKFVEELGYYNPHAKAGEEFNVDEKRVDYWLSEGVKVSTTVASFLKKIKLENAALVDVRKKKTNKAKKKEETEGDDKDKAADKPSKEADKKEEVKK